MYFAQPEIVQFLIETENLLGNRIEETHLPPAFYDSQVYSFARNLYEEAGFLQRWFTDFKYVYLTYLQNPTILTKLPKELNLKGVAQALHTFALLIPYFSARHEYLLYVNLYRDSSLHSHYLEKYLNARKAFFHSRLKRNRNYISKFEDETNHARNVLRILLQLPESKNFNIFTLIFVSTLHDIGKYYRGDTEGMRAEAAYPFLHQIYGLPEIYEYQLALSAKFGCSLDLDQILSAVRLHSSKCYILDQFVHLPTKWNKHDRYFAKLQREMQEHNTNHDPFLSYFLSEYQDIRKNGFVPMPRKSPETLLAHLLSDADNLAQLTLFQQNEFTETGISRSKFFKILEIQMVDDNKNNVSEILDEMEIRFAVLEASDSPYQLSSPEALKLLQQQFKHYRRIKEEIQLHNDQEKQEINKILDLNSEMKEQERKDIAKHNMDIIYGIVDNYLAQHTPEIQAELGIHKEIMIDSEYKPIINDRPLQDIEKR